VVTVRGRDGLGRSGLALSVSCIAIELHGSSGHGGRELGTGKWRRGGRAVHANGDLATGGLAITPLYDSCTPRSESSWRGGHRLMDEPCGGAGSWGDLHAGFWPWEILQGRHAYGQGHARLNITTSRGTRLTLFGSRCHQPTRAHQARCGHGWDGTGRAEVRDFARLHHAGGLGVVVLESCWLSGIPVGGILPSCGLGVLSGLLVGTC